MRCSCASDAWTHVGHARACVASDPSDAGHTGNVSRRSLTLQSSVLRHPPQRHPRRKQQRPAPWPGQRHGGRFQRRRQRRRRVRHDGRDRHRCAVRGSRHRRVGLVLQETHLLRKGLILKSVRGRRRFRRPTHSWGRTRRKRSRTGTFRTSRLCCSWRRRTRVLGTCGCCSRGHRR